MTSRDPEQFCPVDVTTAQRLHSWTKDEFINVFLFCL